MADHEQETLGYTASNQGVVAVIPTRNVSDDMKTNFSSSPQEAQNEGSKPPILALTLSQNKEARATPRSAGTLQATTRKHHPDQCKRRMRRHKGEFDELDDDHRKLTFDVHSMDDEPRCVTTDWEVLADSVISFHSHFVRKTYLEALQTNHGKAPSDVVRETKHPSRTRCPLPRKSESNVADDEDEYEGMFDAFFVLEGVKEARGGMRARMFKGEGKKQRFYKARRQKK